MLCIYVLIRHMIYDMYICNISMNPVTRQNPPNYRLSCLWQCFWLLRLDLHPILLSKLLCFQASFVRQLLDVYHLPYFNPWTPLRRKVMLLEEENAKLTSATGLKKGRILDQITGSYCINVYFTSNLKQSSGSWKLLTGGSWIML